MRVASLNAGITTERRRVEAAGEEVGICKAGAVTCVVPHFPGVVYSPQSTNRNAV